MHLANGLRPADIAKLMFRSTSEINQRIIASRKRLGAKTNAHLVSLVIATGDLYWTDDNDRAISPLKHEEAP